MEKIKSNGSLVVVDSKCIAGNGNVINGSSNIINGNGNVIKGNNNTVNGNGNSIQGNGNIVHGNGNFIQGENNSATGNVNRLIRKNDSSKVKTNVSFGDSKVANNQCTINYGGSKFEGNKKIKVNHNVSYGKDSYAYIPEGATVFINGNKYDTERENNNVSQINYINGPDFSGSVFDTPIAYSVNGSVNVNNDFSDNNSTQYSKKPYTKEKEESLDIDKRIKSDNVTIASEEKGDKACSVCFENQIKVMFLNCGHCACCQKCSLDLVKVDKGLRKATCPICRKNITAMKIIEFS